MNLRPYQHEAVNKTIEFLELKKGNPCIIAPTGSGKSLVIASLIERLNKKVLILSHRKEILEQNEEKLLRIAPNLSVGIYSASLKRKQIRPVTFGQIQSIAKLANTGRLSEFELMIVDESHLIPKNEDTQYQKIIKALNIPVVGLTASPMRLDSGPIIGDGQIFDDVSYEISMTQLIKEGYLAPLVGKSSVVQADLSDVQKRGGEFILEQARQKIDIDSMTLAAIQECMKYAKDRKAWIIFASGVEHAQKVSNAFANFGISNHVITGDTLPMHRDKYISEFRNNKIRALINCEVLTTGFDSPNVDCIVLLRATNSTSLYLQILGRGSRPYPEKTNCLVLDFCGNLERHGPVDLINYKDFFERPKGDGEAPGKVCPNCRSIVHAAARECLDCGHQFPEPEIKHDKKASDADPMTVIEPPRSFDVTDIEVTVMESKKDQTPMMVVTYHSGFNKFKEWVLFDHQGCRNMVCKWWADRTINLNTPVNSQDAASRFYREAWAIKKVWVKKETLNKPGKSHTFYKVIGVTKEPFLLKDKVVEDELII